VKSKVYQFPKPRKIGADVTIPAPVVRQPADEATKMQSSLEMRVYQALLALGWKKEQIDVQTPVLGGRRRVGGLVLDFIVYTPLPIPIRVNGEYWHKNAETEAEMENKLKNYFKAEIVTIWGDEARTLQDAISVVRRKVGKA
jgi:hypothetical protein